MEASARVLLGETHMIGKTIIVNGKKGRVIEQVGSDGKTESDEIYKVKCEDGTVKDIPARDMEMQGGISNRKEPSENEAEDIVNEGHDCAKIHPNMSHKEWKKTQKESVELDELEDKTLKSYMTKAHDQSIKGQQQSGKTLKRIQGFIKAQKKLQDHVELGEGIWKDTGNLVKQLIRNPRMKAPTRGSEPKPKKPKPKKSHGIKSDPAYKRARTQKQIKQARDQWNLKNPMDLWVGESVEVDESLGGPGGPSRQISPAGMYQMVADREKRAKEREEIRKNKNKNKKKRK